MKWPDKSLPPTAGPTTSFAFTKAEVAENAADKPALSS